MSKSWIVNPGFNFVSKVAVVGRFLESDYKMAIREAEIPLNFKSNLEPTARRFVIVGAKSVPMATAKSVFLCLRLAGAESIVVKTATEDEGLLVKNVLDNWTPEGVETKIFSIGSDRLRDYPEWKEAVDQSTDIVVFGGEDTVDSFMELESKDRRIHVHGPKFSFGIVNVADLTLTRMRDICSDFGTFYGEGCLSPRFYVIVGESDHDWLGQASMIMTAEHGYNIEEFRHKLPMARKSRLVQDLVSSNMAYKYVREETLEDNKVLTDLYGDARFVMVKDLKELWPFLDRWQNRISSVATLDYDEEINLLLDRFRITRSCDFGMMQFPGFYEKFDTTDDFDIYGAEE